MARALKHKKIDTPAAREKLPRSASTYWAKMEKGFALGYRRGRNGGTWIAKFRQDGRRKETALGRADDTLPADGVTVLTHAQASEAARDWFKLQGNVALGLAVDTRRYTVQDAVTDYMIDFRTHKKSVKETEATINAFIIPEFGPVVVSMLRAEKIRKWHAEIAKAAPRLRSKEGQKFKVIAKDDPDTERRRKSTANRILSVLKAVLNKAFEDRKVSNDDEWRRVKPFKGVENARPRYLSPSEWRKLLSAADVGFRPIVQAALLTGARYSELARLRARDFSKAGGTLSVQQTKAGAPRTIYLTDEGVEYFQALCESKNSDSLLFTHGEGLAWGKSHQFRPMNEACKKAGIPAAGFHALRHTYASHAIMNGAKPEIVAKNLGHTDTRMVMKHYGHLAEDHVRDAIRSAAPRIGGSVSE